MTHSDVIGSSSGGIEGKLYAGLVLLTSLPEHMVDIPGRHRHRLGVISLLCHDEGPIGTQDNKFSCRLEAEEQLHQMIGLSQRP
jgi:hypothetical protein